MCLSIPHIFILELIGCNNNEVHLVNGSSSNEGRVEVCIEGEWGTVSDNTWNRRNAQVICKQLGYQPGCKLIKHTMKLFCLL